MLLPFACGWYLLSVAATNDWLWPVAYNNTLATLYRSDAVLNGDFSVNVPGILVHVGLPSLVAWLIGAALLLGGFAALSRVGRIEAASVAPLIGIAASPHAYGYDAILALPSFWLLIAYPGGPLSFAAVCIAYLIAPLYVLARPIHFDVLAIPVIGGVAAWSLIRRRALLTFDPRNDRETA